MKIKNSNFYLSVTLVLILSICFAVTPSQAGSAVASGSAGPVSATGQVYLHLSDESMPYATGSGMVEIDVVGGDFQIVEGELWASYETSLTNNQISVVAAGGADQVKIVLATGHIGNDPSTSDTFETIYIPSDDTESKPSAKGDDPNAEKPPLHDMQEGSGSGEPTPNPTLSIRNEPQDTKPKPSEQGDDPNAEKPALRDMQEGSGSGEPTPNPTLSIRNEPQDTKPKPSEQGDDPNAEKPALHDMQVRRPAKGDDPNAEKPALHDMQVRRPAKGDDPNAEKPALHDMPVRTEGEDQNADENPDAPQRSGDQNADENPDAPQQSSDEGDESEE